MSALPLTGERQVATDLDLITPDHRKRYEFAVEWIEDNIDENKEIRLLDAACGNGYGTFILASGLDSKVLGLDISQEAIDCAKQHYNINNLTDFKKFDFVTNTIEDDKFDIVVSFETLEHLLNPESLLLKFSKLSDLLICSVPNEDVLPYNHNNFPFHFKHYTVDDLTELLTSTGWNPIDWYTQYSKKEGDVYEADDGRTIIVIAEKIKL